MIAAAHAAARARLGDLEDAPLMREIESLGHARVRALLDAAACSALADNFDRDPLYRSTVDMKRHNFGNGVYRYFAYPLPDLVEDLRTRLYPTLSRIANQWQQALGRDYVYPARHQDYLSHCHAAGQRKPTPLILRYGADGYNCLHQDLYGDEVFPLQVAILLSQPVEDFSGGEFVLTEQRPRMQSRAEVIPLDRGDAVIFPVSRRPLRGSRGFYQVNMRHGVSRVRSGQRLTLGIIFHDAA